MNRTAQKCFPRVSGLNCGGMLASAPIVARMRAVYSEAVGVLKAVPAFAADWPCLSDEELAESTFKALASYSVHFPSTQQVSHS